VATVFPGSNDSFSEPSAPSSTPLNNAGGSGRDHDDNLRDMADAVMAMQAEATLLTHSHNGSTFKHGIKLAQANTHQTADTDVAAASIHHTIDASLTNPFKAAAANHSHGATNPWPVGVIYISEVSTNPATLGLPGTWTAITSAFLVAAGSTFTAGATGGATTHTHTFTVSSDGAHSHTPTVDATGNHYHTYDGGIGYATFGHYHYMGAGTVSTIDVPNTGGNSATTGGHEHDGGLSSGSNHVHSPPGNSDWGIGSTTHGVSATSTNSAHTHTVGSASSESNLPAYLPVYVWYRSA